MILWLYKLMQHGEFKFFKLNDKLYNSTRTSIHLRMELKSVNKEVTNALYDVGKDVLREVQFLYAT